MINLRYCKILRVYIILIIQTIKKTTFIGLDYNFNNVVLEVLSVLLSVSKQKKLVSLN